MPDGQNDHVTVYAFVEYMDGHELGAVAPFKMTREAIEGTPTAHVLEGTAQRVPVEQLDAQGRLMRSLAPDWGRRTAV